MAKLNFTASTAVNKKMKKTPAKYRESAGRPNISQSDGIRPAFPLMPYAHLPKSFEDVSTQDSVVIPKGRIVSAITQNSDLGDGTSYYSVGKGIMGLMVPCNGNVNRDVVSPVDGSTKTIAKNLPIGIAEHDVYQDINGDNLNYDMRNKNWGVLTQQLIKIPAVDTYYFDDFMGEAGSFVPADATGTDGNAENITGTYSATIDISGATGSNVNLTFATYAAAFTGAKFQSVTGITAGGAALALTTDYTVNAGNGTITFVKDNAEDEIVVTFVYDLENLSSGAPVDATDVSTFGYAAVEKEYSFYTYNSENGEGDAGELLKSDFYGNWMPDSGDTANTVGRLMGVDYRFGKDLLDTVQSKWDDDADFALAGTGTMGVPQFLFDFAYTALNKAVVKAGTTWAAKWPNTDEAKVVKNAVDAGVFGEAWIQLDV